MSIQSFKLPVSYGHTLHVEVAGNPDGIPVLYLHGGPGAGINGNYQWPFDLQRYMVVAFDQRGCGHSQPFGCLEHNSTDDLIEDIEVLRKHLNIDSWYVFGGSWGSTLALCYAIAHPLSVRTMILRGVFLARQQDFDWFLEPGGGAAQVFPDAYSRFYGQVSGQLNRSAEIADAFFEQFSSSDDNIARAALSAWFNWEGAISKLIPDKQPSSEIASNQQVKSLALLECHYLKHHCFISENYILNHAHIIKRIPTYIVHGRYDMVCQVSAAYHLHKALSHSALHIIDNAGHSASEPAIKSTLKSIMDELALNYRAQA
ncbi:prolyl aminopeptidase [Glaciecola siphonariae]|uniref:Proline iminopeptidase n=1 Tax=Glaciecola siphonariae TaxID=521012 RepID=A0ABV9LYI5_9ALTE